MPSISLIGLNHRTAPVELRERYSLSADEQQAMLATLQDQVDEAVILSTCNRTEIIYHGQNGTATDAVMAALLTHGKLPKDELQPYLYSLTGHDGLMHLFRVAASLDSLVPGETQIIGQVKEAFDQAFRCGCVHANFNHIYQRMLHTSKLVRSATGLGQGAVSVSSVAVRLARSIFEDMESKRVLLIGAGKMSALAAEYFQTSHIGGISIANRTAEKAHLMAKDFNGTGHGLDELPELLKTHDIVFCSTRSQELVLTYKLIRQAASARRGPPMLLVDLSVPRNIDPKVAQIPDVYLYNIDDLQAIVEERIAERKQQADQAEAIIRQQIQDFERDVSESIGPVIRSLRERVEVIKKDQLAKLYNGKQEYSEAQQQEIDRSVDLIVNKLLHDPLISLRRGMEDEDRGSRNLVGVFKYLFNL